MTHAIPKILVVDDNAANRAVYREWINSVGGVEVLEANGGQSAVEMANRHDFAMIVLDVNMPDMDGFETASILRQEQRLDQSPIVFISGEFNRNQRVRGYRMGAVDCLVTEPLDPEILAQKARVFLQLFRKRQELQDALEETRKHNAKLHTELASYVDEQQKSRREVTHDLLTGIPNRSLFNDRLQGAVKRAERSRQHFALAYVDLDGFKAINDRHGHSGGDELIRIVAERLRRGVRASDTVARLGGDEFGLLFEGIESYAAAEYLAAKLQRLLQTTVELSSEDHGQSVQVSIGASIGIAMYPNHASSHEELRLLADKAMYAAKRSGGGVRVYDQSLGTATPAPVAATSLKS